MKKSEKTSILESFSEAKTAKNREKMVLKNVCFFNIDFFAFFCVFFGFWVDFGGPGPSKNREKIEKIDFLTRSFFKEGSGRVLGGSWDGFEVIFKGFWERFWSDFWRFWLDFRWILGTFWSDFLKLLARIWGKNND